MQFSSLEPEIVCRLLYVKEVDFLPESLAKGPALSAPSGQTELPTCPVCLERLDEHISGVATTVRFRHQNMQYHLHKCPKADHSDLCCSSFVVRKLGL